MLATIATATLVGGGASAAAGSGPPGPCGATGVLAGASASTCTYDTVGSDTFTVPARVTQASFTVVGGAGGHYYIAGNGTPSEGDITGRPGGAGGEVTATLTLTPGELLEIDVAGRGVNGTAASRTGGMKNGPSGGVGALGGFGGSDGGVAGGPGDATGANGGTAFNGGNGAGGGGSSDVRAGPDGCAATLTCPLPARLIVAAGGGGGGGIGGQGLALGGAGGSGGGGDGSPGGSVIDGGNPGAPGAGGTPTAGGAPGENAARHEPGANPSDPRFGGDGAPGGAGSGGAGGLGNLPCTGTQNPPCQSSATSSGGGAGGGGGGGLFGGGGGGGGGGLYGGAGGAGGGGGGGSSFVTPQAIASSVSAGSSCDPTAAYPCTPTVNGGNGEVVVSWTSPPRATPALATTATPAAYAGSPISDSATLSGGSSPSGTITFQVFGPQDTSCQTPLASSTATVSSDGTFASAAFTPQTPGTYRWVAGYSGDGGNDGVTGTCGATGETVDVRAKPRSPAKKPTRPAPPKAKPKRRSPVSGAGGQGVSSAPGPPSASGPGQSTAAPAAAAPGASTPVASTTGRGAHNGPSRGGAGGSRGARGVLTGLLVSGSRSSVASPTTQSLLRLAGGAPKAGGGVSWVAELLGVLVVVALVTGGWAREVLPRSRSRPEARTS